VNNKQVIITSIIEGISETLPISSTAHIMIVSKLIGVSYDDELFQLFYTSIQIGAIIAIIHNLSNEFNMLYNEDNTIYKKIFISLIPILILGVLMHIYKIKLVYSKNNMTIFLFIGGLLLITAHYIKTKYRRINTTNAIIIGLLQCFAVIPGLSRSGITIFAGIIQKIHKNICIYFSFGLAMPTIICAFINKFYKIILLNKLNIIDIQFMIIGNIISFIASNIMIKIIKYQIKYNKFNFIPYLGLYRIIISIFLYYYM
jgi:undecaprenyl-diphosphatase